MAKKRQGRKAKKSQGSRRFAGLALRIILLAIVALPLALLYLLPYPKGIKPDRPPLEEFSKAPETPPQFKKKKTVQRPKVAIIIDDMGYDLSMDRRFLELDPNISVAFLPFAPFTKLLAKEASRKGHDVLVHLPMEPENKGLNPGPGVLTLDMGFDEIISTIKKDLLAVPYAKGVNNHMGSAFTKDKEKMEIVLAFLKEEGLFFVDSRTTKDTVAYAVAKKMGLPCAQRTVFLDHSFSKKKIYQQIKRLMILSKKKGEVIAIGHPLKNTFDVLYEKLPHIKRDVDIVPVHRLVH